MFAVSVGLIYKFCLITMKYLPHIFSFLERKEVE